MSAWSALLVGGASGTGKTTAAKAIAHRRGVAWVQVDDLRLALQWSGARLPSEADTEALYHFLRTPDVWSQPAGGLCDALIGVGRAMTDAIAVVIAHHVIQHDSVVIEGDGILPELLEHGKVRPHVASGAVRMVVLAPDSEDALLRAMLARGRGIAETGFTPEARRAAEAGWRFSQWLRREAEARSIPPVASEPWGTLSDRNPCVIVKPPSLSHSAGVRMEQTCYDGAIVTCRHRRR